MPSKSGLKGQKAAIGWLANHKTSTHTLSNVDRNVVERIRKCFARAYHANATEIMKQYHIGQAELMEEEDKTARAERGGISTVNI